MWLFPPCVFLPSNALCVLRKMDVVAHLAVGAGDNYVAIHSAASG